MIFRGTLGILRNCLKKKKKKKRTHSKRSSAVRAKSGIRVDFANYTDTRRKIRFDDFQRLIRWACTCARQGRGPFHFNWKQSQDWSFDQNEFQSRNNILNIHHIRKQRCRMKADYAPINRWIIRFLENSWSNVFLPSEIEIQLKPKFELRSTGNWEVEFWEVQVGWPIKKRKSDGESRNSSLRSLSQLAN